jgi:hypothetical protein
MIAPSDDSTLTEIAVERICACPFSIAQSYAQDYLERAESTGASPLIVSPFALPFLRRSVAMTFSVVADETERGRAHEAVILHWKSGFALLPDFRGTIRFRAARRETLVRIEGRYAPPLGRFGTVFDGLVGKWIAKETVTDLLRRIAKSLEGRQRDWLLRQVTTGT